MRNLFAGLSVAAALFFSIGAHAQAQQFNYTYMFQSGDVVNGTFVGTASGDLITGLSNITASLDGVALSGSGSLFGSSYIGNQFVSGNAVVSFDGLQNNFLFIDTNFPINPAYTNYFGSIPGPSGGTQAFTINTGYVTDNALNGANWSVTAAVPEPSSYALAIVGLFAIFAVKQRAANQV